MAATYDPENASRGDLDWYRALAERLRATDVVDLGCGTGVLAIDLAARGHAVIGVDPAAAMLDIARSRPGGADVTWILGDARVLGLETADLVIMSGNVAQVFLTDADWMEVLGRISRCLRPGGHLAFETRSPEARAWEHWTREASLGRYVTETGRPFRSWVESAELAGEVVRFDAVVSYEDTGETIIAPDALRFRTEEGLRSTLRAASFVDIAIAGDWHGGPVMPESRELIVVAERAGSANSQARE